MTITGIPLAIATAAALMNFAGQVKTTAPRPMVLSVKPLATASNVMVTPATLSFTLSDPDGAAVTGSGALQWQITGGKNGKTWTVDVSSTGGSCGEIPLSAVTAQCTSVVPPAFKLTCLGPVALTGSAQQVASGREDTTDGDQTTVNVTFAITDAWKYKGHTTKPCTIPVTYTLTLP